MYWIKIKMCYSRFNYTYTYTLRIHLVIVVSAVVLNNFTVTIYTRETSLWGHVHWLTNMRWETPMHRAATDVRPLPFWPEHVSHGQVRQDEDWSALSAELQDADTGNTLFRHLHMPTQHITHITVMNIWKSAFVFHKIIVNWNLLMFVLFLLHSSRGYFSVCLFFTVWPEKHCICQLKLFTVYSIV